MKLLSICDPTHYGNPPLDVPTFYQRVSQDPRIDFYHLPTPQVLEGGFPEILAIPTQGELSYPDFLELGNSVPCSISLIEIDVVFCRTLKPFPPGYLDRLSQWESFTRFINRPSSKKLQIQSSFLLEVGGSYIPETIVTKDEEAALAFLEQYQTIIAKQANSTGGKGVFKIWYQDQGFHVDNAYTGTRVFADFSALLAALQTGQTEPLQMCRYLSRTHEGDKRVVVVDGEIYGSYLRRSKSGHWVNNVSKDGECALVEITQDELEAIENTVHHYQRLGLHTLGYDFLMDDDGTWRISEINAGNIGGFARLELLTGQPVVARFIDWIIKFASHPSDTAPFPCSPNLGAA